MRGSFGLSATHAYIRRKSSRPTKLIRNAQAPEPFIVCGRAQFARQLFAMAKKELAAARAISKEVGQDGKVSIRRANRTILARRVFDKAGHAHPLRQKLARSCG